MHSPIYLPPLPSFPSLPSFPYLSLPPRPSLSSLILRLFLLFLLFLLFFRLLRFPLFHPPILFLLLLHLHLLFLFALLFRLLVFFHFFAILLFTSSFSSPSSCALRIYRGNRGPVEIYGFCVEEGSRPLIFKSATQAVGSFGRALTSDNYSTLQMVGSKLELLTLYIRIVVKFRYLRLPASFAPPSAFLSIRLFLPSILFLLSFSLLRFLLFNLLILSPLFPFISFSSFYSFSSFPSFYSFSSFSSFLFLLILLFLLFLRVTNIHRK